MKTALINPHWTFDGSVYFGCREPHLPIEYGYAKSLLERDGHEALILDGHSDALSHEEMGKRLKDFKPDLTVITTAPGYLFWRCAPPELRVPRETARALRELAGLILVVGPHGSVTPLVTLAKVGGDAVIRGEFEAVLPELARRARGDWKAIPSLVLRGGSPGHSVPHSADMSSLPALHWSPDTLASHSHHHHRFDKSPSGPGAEMETSRGCPYHCAFCAKESFRNGYRRRPLAVVLEELDGLLAHGVRYVYFVDEIFMPNRELLEALRDREVEFGVQLRIDLWDEEMLELLGRAGCVSIEAGVESITAEGRKGLDKHCSLSIEGITRRLAFAKRYVPFVQANLVDTGLDDPSAVEGWRGVLLSHGVWANKPVPLFPYPGSPMYRRLWGEPDERAWERAHAHYLKLQPVFSDIQDQQPLPLATLESISDEGAPRTADVELT